MSDPDEALQTTGDGAPTEISTREFSRKEVELLKRTIAKDCTDAELSMFIQNCKRYGLDPFTGQIHAVKRKSELQIQVGIDGFRLIADRTGKWRGTVGPYWCDQSGEWRDVWLSNDNPAAAKVGVLRSDFEKPRWGIARWSAYVATKNGKPTFMWRDMPAHMLAKCAEALALRSAFPNDLSGLYTNAEMQQADGGEKRSYDGPAPSEVQDIEAEVVNGKQTRKSDQWYEDATESLKQKVREGMEPAHILAYADEAPTSHPIDDWPEEKAEPLIKWLKKGERPGGQAAAEREAQAAKETQAENGKRRYEDADDALQSTFDAAWRTEQNEDWDSINENQLNRLYAIADEHDWDESALNRLVKDELGWESKKDIPYGDPYDEVCEVLEDERLRYHMSRDPDTPDMFEGEDSEEANDPAFEDGADDDDLPF